MECERGTEPAIWVFTQAQSDLPPTKRFSCAHHRAEVATSIETAKNSRVFGSFELKFDFRRHIASEDGTDSAGVRYQKGTPLWMLQNAAVDPVNWRAFVFVNIFEFVQTARDTRKWSEEDVARLESDAAHTKF
jgi:hypothetical protein